ncbi:MAG: response regulator [Lysobacterales bacterium]
MTIVSPSEILAARILIVDDQSANVQLLEQLLADTGYSQVSSTTNPAEVFELHRAQHFDLILLDLQMPQMDGFEVMEALKLDVADDYLPVIVFTAQPGHKLRALQAGAKDFIAKPFDLIEARTRIHNMLEVRLLYKKIEQANLHLEQVVAERTAELRESEARYRSLTELAADWYWEQDDGGRFTRIYGPALELLGLAADQEDPALKQRSSGWDESQRDRLRAAIAERRPFLDFVFSRMRPDGSRQQFRVSGEPMFNAASRYVGYRGIGVEIMPTDLPDPSL